jgi:hypothetical protein
MDQHHCSLATTTALVTTPWGVCRLPHTHQLHARLLCCVVHYALRFERPEEGGGRAESTVDVNALDVGCVCEEGGRSTYCARRHMLALCTPGTLDSSCYTHCSNDTGISAVKIQDNRTGCPARAAPTTERGTAHLLQMHQAVILMPPPPRASGCTECRASTLQQCPVRCAHPEIFLSKAPPP